MTMRRRILALALCAGCGGNGGLKVGGDGGSGDGGRSDVAAASHTMCERAPMLAITPILFDFGRASVGKESPAQAFELVFDACGAPAVSTTGDFKIVANGCAAATGRSCTVTVAFAPAASGPRMGTLELAAGGVRTSAFLSGIGRFAGPLTITPREHEFPAVTTGGEGEPVRFTVKNEGASEAPAPAVAATGDFAVKANGCAAALAPGATCSVEVVSSPRSDGSKSGTLTVTSEDGVATATLAGRGHSIHHALLFAPASVDFGPVGIGRTSGTRTVTVTNPGGGPIFPLSFAIVGSTEFIVPAVGGCGATLWPGGSCTVEVAFAPTGAGLRTASLVVSFQGGSAMASLSGLGLVADGLVVSPSRLDFGPVPIGGASSAMIVVVRNYGDVNVEKLEVRLEGQGADQFAFASACGAVIQPGLASACEIAVVSKPTREGPLTAELVIRGTPGGTTTVTLRATGAHVDGLGISPSAQKFPETPVGSASPAQVFVVRNHADVKLGALKLDLLGVDASQFRIVKDGCAGVALGGGATCSVAVVLQPTSAGAKSAVLAAVASPGGTASAQLTGQATPPFAPDISPPSADFGRVPFGQKGVAIQFKVPHGPTPGPSARTTSAAFEVLSTACDDEANGGCYISVQFTPPGVAGEYEGELVVTYPGGQAISARLVGTVVPGDYGMILNEAKQSVSVFDFSAVPADAPNGANRRDYGTKLEARSPEVTFYMRNLGEVPTGLPSLAKAGAHADDFVITNNGCAASLGPGAECSFRVVFAPTAVGDREGAIDVTFATGGTASLALRGVGVPR